jgi:hypothetical protein
MMQSFVVCTKIINKKSKEKNAKQCKMPIFFGIFNITKIKMHALKSNLISSPTVYKKRQLKEDTKKQNT